MANSSKPLSTLDGTQTLQGAFNEADSTLSVNGFATSKVGHKITRTAVSSVIDDYRYLDIVLTKSMTTSNLSTTITGIDTTEGMVAGQYLFGTGIDANTTISSIDSQTQITISQAATASGTVSIKVANLLMTLRVELNATRTDVNSTERLT